MRLSPGQNKSSKKLNNLSCKKQNKQRTQQWSILIPEFTQTSKTAADSNPPTEDITVLLSWVLDKDKIWLNHWYTAWYQDFRVLNTHPTIYKGKKEPVCMFMITCKCVSVAGYHLVSFSSRFSHKNWSAAQQGDITKIHMEWISYWTTLTFITTKISEWTRHTWTRLAFVN